MSDGMRHSEPVDVHLILRRETSTGPEVLLSRRAGQVYASGLWHVPSGHLDGPHEDVVAALVREVREETGVVIDPAGVRAAVTVHHRSPAGFSRTGYFFEVRQWQGEPQIAEPDRCDAMEWARLDDLPAGMVAYCRAGLDAYLAGARTAIHFQLPGDVIAFDPGADRLRLVPGADGPTLTGQPTRLVVEFAEQVVGRITEWVDVSWARENSCVWRAHGAQGGTWYVKVHQNEKFHAREVRAYRTWARSLDAAVPRLVAADQQLRAIVVTVVAGKVLHGAALSPAQERDVFAELGALARRIHQAAPPQPAPEGAGPAVAKAERHIAAARPHLAPGDEEFVRRLVRQAETLPALPCVETHGDFQLRNVLHRYDGSLALLDFERSEPGPAVRDLVRLSDAWACRPDLYEAFMAGYGRALTAAEKARLVIDSALDAVSGIQFGVAHRDVELVERGHRTLAHLRAEHEVRSPGGCPPGDTTFPGIGGSPDAGRQTPVRADVPRCIPQGSGGGEGSGWMPTAVYAETVPKATCFACVYFTDEDDRPLQLHSVYSPEHPWQLVGGTMDPGERPFGTAVRECQEETGLTPLGPPRLLALVYGLPCAGWPYSTVGAVFDGGRLTEEQIRGIALDPREHDEARVLPLAQWEALMPPRDFARLRAVAEARRSGVTAYFETWDWETD